MKTETVAAQDVQVGDRLYNSHATHPAFRWCRVKEIVEGEYPVRLEGGSIKKVKGHELHTSGWYTIKTHGQAVTVQRSAPVIMPAFALLLSVLLTGCASTKHVLGPFRPSAVSIQLGEEPTITIHMEQSNECRRNAR